MCCFFKIRYKILKFQEFLKKIGKPGERGGGAALAHFLLRGKCIRLFLLVLSKRKAASALGNCISLIFLPHDSVLEYHVITLYSKKGLLVLRALPTTTVLTHSE
jgi:hypothetical protein